MLSSLLTSMNNFGSQVGNNFNTLTTGADGGLNDRSADNAGRLSDATGAADSKVTNAGIENAEIQADNAVQSMQQKTDINHMNNVSQVVGSISY
jgi:hypothetical protein